MLWYKRFTAWREYPDIARLLDEFGLEGFARLDLMFDVVAQRADETFNLALPWNEWCSILRSKRGQLQKLLAYCQRVGLITREETGNVLTIGVPLLSEITDEYTRKKRRANKDVRSRLDPDLDRDRDGEKDNYPQTPASGGGQKTSDSQTTDERRVTEVFEYWKKRMQQPQGRLDEPRKLAIQRALSLDYSVDDLKHAIRGCSYDPWSMGENENGNVVNDICRILKDAGTIDRFTHTANAPPTSLKHPILNAANNEWLYTLPRLREQGQNRITEADLNEHSARGLAAIGGADAVRDGYDPERERKRREFIEAYWRSHEGDLE